MFICKTEVGDRINKIRLCSQRRKSLMEKYWWKTWNCKRALQLNWSWKRHCTLGVCTHSYNIHFSPRWKCAGNGLFLKNVFAAEAKYLSLVSLYCNIKLLFQWNSLLSFMCNTKPKSIWQTWFLKVIIGLPNLKVGF